MNLDRHSLANEICRRLDVEYEPIARQWYGSAPVNHFVIDDVLPEAWAQRIRAAFPIGSAMTLKKSLRELKYVAAQMDRYDPLLEESIYAFQMLEVVRRIEQLTGLRALEPDSQLYAGGISLMAPGHFLNPHIDNSHDKPRQRYRVLNLLYYVSPQWPQDRGGNLELWQQGLRRPPQTITSSFNRLVVMITHRQSWHSVSPNRAEADRCCVSNYYFSSQPIGGVDYYHVTEFRGRPEQPFKDLMLRGDNWVRTMIRTKLPWAFKNQHYYSKQGSRLSEVSGHPRRSR
jgi:Rps23 Pro-64 3,4-dihydroxylase Tpa1-like proline 4-hydroxylase